jgi:hypothetical protein
MAGFGLLLTQTSFRECWSILQLVSLQKWLLLYLVLDQNIQYVPLATFDQNGAYDLPNTNLYRRRLVSSKPYTMAVINKVSNYPHIHHLLKRHNWASKNPGVILVFCIVFIVALGLGTLFIYRKMLRKKAEKQAYTG